MPCNKQLWNPQNPRYFRTSGLLSGMKFILRPTLHLRKRPNLFKVRKLQLERKTWKWQHFNQQMKQFLQNWSPAHLQIKFQKSLIVSINLKFLRPIFLILHFIASTSKIDSSLESQTPIVSSQTSSTSQQFSSTSQTILNLTSTSSITSQVISTPSSTTTSNLSSISATSSAPTQSFIPTTTSLTPTQSSMLTTTLPSSFSTSTASAALDTNSPTISSTTTSSSSTLTTTPITTVSLQMINMNLLWNCYMPPSQVTTCTPSSCPITSLVDVKFLDNPISTWSKVKFISIVEQQIWKRFLEGSVGIKKCYKL